MCGLVGEYCRSKKEERREEKGGYSWNRSLFLKYWVLFLKVTSFIPVISSSWSGVSTRSSWFSSIAFLRQVPAIDTLLVDTPLVASMVLQ